MNYNWFPSGWMGDLTSPTCDEQWTDNPHEGLTCIRLTYNTKNDTSWAGIYWLPLTSWYGPGINVYQKYNISDTCKFTVRFWARGEVGGENVKFKIGGVTTGGDSIDPPIEKPWIKLSTTWTIYEIDISSTDLSNLIGAFCWVVDNAHNQKVDMVIIYLDDIEYVSQN